MEFERMFREAANVPLSGEVRSHLKNVYSALTLSVLTAAGGASTALLSPGSALFSQGAGFLWGLVALGLAVALVATQDNGKNAASRMGLLLGFAFFSGLGTGPLVGMAVRLNPAILPTAFLLSSTLFACFSAAAIYAPTNHFLYLGGTLLSALSSLFWLSIANLFFRSQMLFEIGLWVGLAVFCGFVVYDTQLIIAKRRNGEKDFIKHAMSLFIDFMDIFRRVLIILMKKEGNKNSSNKRNNRR